MGNFSRGHQAGDETLIDLANLLRSTLSPASVAGRWGGEEFLLIIRNSDFTRGRGIAEKIRRVVSDTPINNGFTSLSVTVTIGISQYRGGSIDNMIIHADEALYEGKRNGKNIVVVS